MASFIFRQGAQFNCAKDSNEIAKNSEIADIYINEDRRYSKEQKERILGQLGNKLHLTKPQCVFSLLKVI